MAQHLDIFSDDRGEGIIDINKTNTLEGYLQRNEDIWGNDENDAKEILKDFIKMGYVTPIKL